MIDKPNNNPPHLPSRAAKVLEKPARFITRGFIYREIPWKERIKIMLGFRVLLEVHIMSEHNPGQFQPVVKFHLTAEQSQATALVALRTQVEAEVEQARKDAKEASE